MSNAKGTAFWSMLAAGVVMSPETAPGRKGCGII